MPVNGSDTDGRAPALVLSLEPPALLCPSVLSAVGKAIIPPGLDAAQKSIFHVWRGIYLRLVSLCSLVAQVHVIKHPARSDAKPGLAEATAGSSPSEHQGTRGGAQRYLNPYPGPSGRRRLEPQNTVEESLVLSFEYIIFDQLETAGWGSAPVDTPSAFTQKVTALTTSKTERT